MNRLQFGKLVFGRSSNGEDGGRVAPRYGFESHTLYDVGFYTFIFPRSRMAEKEKVNSDVRSNG